MPEATIFDHYEVCTRDDGSLFELGRGAMGITYKAFDTSLRIPVALKVINTTYLASEVARQRFAREARSAAKLRHQHVASVFHLCTEGDTWFYTMEFIDGETVEALIKRQGPLAPHLALTITGQVARALNAAWQHGLVHRDIKPANLMLVHVDDELSAKVIDFGLAKTSFGGDAEDAATLSVGGFVGTPHFASPEQLEEKEIDTRSDIYSLGVTLWYMLAGQAPFAGSMAQVMSQHLSRPPPFEKMENLPPAAADLLRKMLEKDPADRFQTPNDLRKAIDEVLGHIGDAPAAAAGEAASEEGEFATLLETAAVRPGETRFEVGVVLAGRYRIKEVLGETNTGRVFRGYDAQRQRDVRVLVLQPDFLSGPGACTALEQEVEKLKPVQHENLLGVFDFETIEQASFLALEWTDGFSLLELLRARRELEAGETLALLQQGAAGIDQALALGLGGLEFGLHQVLLHFPQEVEKNALLRTPLADWPAFALKLYPLGFTRDLASSQTWAGGQTMVEGAAGAQARGVAVGPRYIQALAALGYELLGGTLSPVASAAGISPRYTPLATLSEEGNEVLRQALDPARSFASAQEFCDALVQLEGLQVRRHESSPAKSSSAPMSVAPKLPPALPTVKKKAPLALIAGLAALLILASAGYFFLPKGGEKTADNPPEMHGEGTPQVTPGVTPEITPDKVPVAPPIATATPAPATPAPMTPAPPTRQELLRVRVDKAQKLEEDGEWAPSLDAWLKIAREFPESGAATNHLETMLGGLRKRPNPLSPDDFKGMRPQITEAAQVGIFSAMMLLGDNVREFEPAIAFTWYTTAAEKGHAPALTQLGLMLSNGWGTEKPDFVKAAQSFQAAADKGDISGKFALGECFLFGKGVAKDETRAVELLREAIAGGDARAMDRLGDCYKRGLGVKINFAEAFRLFTRAVEGGNRSALGNLGVLYMTGQGVPAPNPKKAAELFDKGARAGDSASMFNLAQCLEDGLGVPRNQLQSQAWYRKSALAGDKRGIEWCRKHDVPLTPR